MNKKVAPRRITVSVGACLLALAGAVLAASGCSKREAAPSREATPVREVSPEPSAVAASPKAASPKAETDAYSVELKGTGPYKAGVEGAVELTLRARGGYHMNDQYPFRFKAADPPAEGIRYPKTAVGRADFSFAEEDRNNPKNPEHKFDTARAQIPFLASKSGRATVAGTLLMSVCSDASCIMDKVPLELAVDVN